MRRSSSGRRLLQNKPIARINAEVDTTQEDFNKLIADASGAENICEVGIKVYDSEDEDGSLVGQQVAPGQLLNRCQQWAANKLKAPFKGKAWNADQSKLTVHIELKKRAPQPALAKSRKRKDKCSDIDNINDDAPQRSRQRTEENSAIVRAARDHLPYKDDGSLRVLIAKDVQAEPSLQSLWDGCQGAAYEQVCQQVTEEIPFDVFKKKYNKYATDFNAHRAKYEKEKEKSKAALHGQEDALSKKPWRKKWNSEARAAWYRYKYAHPRKPGDDKPPPSERRLAVAKRELTAGQQALLTAHKERQQSDDPLPSSVPAAGVVQKRDLVLTGKNIIAGINGPLASMLRSEVVKAISNVQSAEGAVGQQSGSSQGTQATQPVATPSTQQATLLQLAANAVNMLASEKEKKNQNAKDRRAASAAAAKAKAGSGSAGKEKNKKSKAKQAGKPRGKKAAAQTRTRKSKKEAEVEVDEESEEDVEESSSSDKSVDSDEE